MHRLKVEVIKKDGTREKFSRAKLVRGMIRAGLQKHIAEEIADKVQLKLTDKSEISSSWIRQEVISLIREIDTKLAEEFAMFQKSIRNLAKNEQYIETKLRLLVGSAGEVKSVYGGFHIIVNDPDEFDFYGVFLELLRYSQSIQIEADNDKLKIVSK
ncbi:MAG: ATP cone domain-containing protein [Candidatus Micrarchaeota archaeon]|nr:ATP cone domain-containing protein [Candidatus Micrarchaeota archaeon]